MSLTAFGYEQADGTVKYGLTFAEYSFEEVVNYIELKTVIYDVQLTQTTVSADDYFTKTRYMNENTKWRILYLSCGEAICQSNTMKGFLIHSLG